GSSDPSRVSSFGRVPEEPGSPCENIIAQDPLVKRGHPVTLFLYRHTQGSGDRLGRSIFVVGIYLNGLSHLSSRSRKFAQDQNSIAVRLTGHVFLCHEVLSVAQRRNERRIRNGI